MGKQQVASIYFLLLSKTCLLEAECDHWCRSYSSSSRWNFSQKAVCLQQQIVAAMPQWDQWHSLSIWGQKRETEMGEWKRECCLFLLSAACTSVIPSNYHCCAKHKENPNLLGRVALLNACTHVSLGPLFHAQDNTHTKWWDLLNMETRLTFPTGDTWVSKDADWGRVCFIFNNVIGPVWRSLQKPGTWLMPL